MSAFQIFRCLLGNHQHSTRVSRDENGVVRSHCVGCGRRMVRMEEGLHREWTLERKERGE